MLNEQAQQLSCPCLHNVSSRVRENEGVPPLEGATHMTQSQPGLHTRNTKETENKESLELSLKTQIRLVIQPGPFSDPGGPRRAQGGQIWSQLPPIGPPWLGSWSPHTLTRYRPLPLPNSLWESFLSGCIAYQHLLTCIILKRALVNYRVVHLVIF